MTAIYPVVNDEGYEIDARFERLDLPFVVQHLNEESYWAKGLGEERLLRSLSQSLCFGLFAKDRQQTGFARVVSDQARFCYLSDVFITEVHRKRGLGKWLVATVLADPRFEGASWLLAAADAHGLYSRFGFGPADPARLMRRNAPVA